jgi:plasminogen activator inhibitor 1 RNA-binding protein
METSYTGIGITNRYDLFLDEDSDPLEILKLQEAEKNKDKTKKDKTARPAKDTGAKKTGEFCNTTAINCKLLVAQF